MISALDELGSPLNTLADRNDLFSSVVPAGWRIAYARKINEAGQIGCELIPTLEPMNTDLTEVLLAVEQPNSDGTPGGLTLVDPDDAKTTQRILEMNEAGDLLVAYDRYSDQRGNQFFDNRLYVRQGDGTYQPTLLTKMTDWTPDFNSALEVASAPHPDRNKLYRFAGPDATLLRELGR